MTTEYVPVNALVEWLVAWRSRPDDAPGAPWTAQARVFDDPSAAAKFARGLELLGEAADTVRYVTVHLRVGEVSASEWAELDRRDWPRYQRRQPVAEVDD